MRTADERFDEKWTPEPNTGCWVWMASSSDDGYGQFWSEEKMVRAHRYAYERWVGPIPEGLTIDHLCRVRHCVNPDHLEAVTNRENILRGETIAAAYAARTHCLQGHPYDEENTYVPPRGGRRECRTCRRARGQDWYSRVGRDRRAAAAEAAVG